MVINVSLKRRRQETLTQLANAKTTNIQLIKTFEEKKAEEHRCEQTIIDKCAEMSTSLQQRMDELIATGSVAATSKKTEKMLEKAHQWSQEMTDRLASILCLQESPERSRASLAMAAANNNTLLDTTMARRQAAAAAQPQLAGLSTSFYVQQGRKSLSVSIQKSPRTRAIHKNNNRSMMEDNELDGEDKQPGTRNAITETPTDNTGEEEDSTMEQEPSRAPTPPPPLPDMHVVENELTYTRKGEKKHFTVQNRLGHFKMVRISGITEPFQCKARVMNMPPHSQMPLSIAFVPTAKQRGMEFSCTMTLRTPGENDQDDLIVQRPLTGQWS